MAMRGPRFWGQFAESFVKFACGFPLRIPVHALVPATDWALMIPRKSVLAFCLETHYYRD